MAITRILYKSLLKQARALAKPTPASKLLIYKDEYSRDYSNTLLTAGEHQYLEALNSYLGGPEAAMLALHKTDSTDLSEIIKANFRSSPPTSASLDAGFLALKQLTNKVKWGNQLEMEKRSPPTTPIKATMESHEVKPGTFLVAHPLLNGFFERTVISIIKTSEKEGVYGAIVNRPTHFSSPLPLSEIFQKPLPPNFKECFESKMVDLGGPVIDNLQMLHNNPSVGGISIGDGMFYAGGDVSKAIEAVKLKAAKKSDFKFFTGCCVWAPDQLESELEAGFWTVVSTPKVASVVLGSHNDQETDNDQLWKGLMAGIGKEEFTRIPPLSQCGRKQNLNGLLLTGSEKRENDDGHSSELAYPSNYL